MRAPQPPAPSAKVRSSMKKPTTAGSRFDDQSVRRPRLVDDQIVAGLLQLVARVGDQARLVEAIRAQQEAEVAAAARVFGEGDGEAGDLLDRIEAGAALEFGERLLVGLRFDRQRLDLGGGGAGAQLADVDARRRCAPMRETARGGPARSARGRRRCRAGSRRGTRRARREQEERHRRCINSAADDLDSHAVQRRACLCDARTSRESRSWIAAGRAEMKYRESDNKSYRPSAGEPGPGRGRRAESTTFASASQSSFTVRASSVAAARKPTAKAAAHGAARWSCGPTARAPEIRDRWGSASSPSTAASGASWANTWASAPTTSPS